MKKLIALIVCLTALVCQAQVEYYAHTKTVYSNGQVVSHDGQSGQFVCRTASDGPKRCYDCTSSGRDHLNGTLFYVGLSNGTEVYKGKAYWGENCIYQFNNSKGLLNVKDANGNVYVYYRSQAPAGRTRSSLLASGASADGWSAREYQATLPDYNNNGDNSGSSSKRGVRSGSKKSTASGSCTRCNGVGRIRAHIGTGGYGVNNAKRHCNVCGKDYYVASDHWHDCPACNGTGRK